VGRRTPPHSCRPAVASWHPHGRPRAPRRLSVRTWSNLRTRHTERHQPYKTIKPPLCCGTKEAAGYKRGGGERRGLDEGALGSIWAAGRTGGRRRTAPRVKRQPARSLNSHTHEPVTEPDARRSGRVRTTARAARLCLCAPVCRVRIVMPSACVRIIMPSACTYLRGVASCVETCSNWAAQTTRLSPRGAYPSRPRSREGPTSRGA